MSNSFRSFLKIVVLLLCITAAVGGVMAFYGTVVAPPRLPELRNPFVPELEERIERYAAYDETGYETVKDAIDYYVYERKISARGRDSLCTDFFYRKYATMLVAHCVESLSGNDWKEASVNFVLGRTDTLLNMRLAARNGSVIPYDSNERSDLDTLKSLLETYRHILAESSDVEYRPGLETSRGRIHSVDSCLEKSYSFRTCPGMVRLGDSEALSAAASSFRSSLKAAHYSYLVNGMNRMRSSGGFAGKDDFEEYSQQLLEEIESFISEADEVYGPEPRYGTEMLERLRTQYTSSKSSGSARYSPLVIQAVKVGVTDYHKNVLVEYGDLVTSSKTRFLTPKLFLYVNEAGKYDITIGLDTPQGSYSYSSSTGYLTVGTHEVILTGYGRDKDGNWPAGDYEYTFKYGDNLLGIRSFHIYDD